LIPHQIMATDTSYIIGGERYSNFQKDVFLLQVKATDFSIIDQIWIGDENRQDYYGELIKTADGGYLMGWFQAGSFPQYYGLLKLNSHFQQEWKEGLSTFNARPGLRSRMSMVEVPNCEGYVILADSDEHANSALLKINILGNLLWAKRYHVPSPTGDQLIAFHDMVWDGNNGVTLLGVNGTQIGAFNYPTAVDYQLLNVDFEGQMRWQRKVTDIEVVIPSDPDYNLINTKILRTADGGYLAAVPGGVGGPNHLIKMDSMGLDGCVMANTIIAEEDISSSFSINLMISDTLMTNPVIQSMTGILPNYENASGASFFAPRCGNINISPVIAAYTAESYTLLVNSTPIVTNFSRGATTYVWKIDGNIVSEPLPAFTNTGTYQVTLEASDGTNTSTTTSQFNIVSEFGCALSCDLTQTTLYTLPSTCPDSDDAGIVSEAVSEIGRTFTYNLYNEGDSLLLTQTTGYFPNLATGNYRIRVISNNEASCFLDLGLISVAPKVDVTPPQALCQTAAVDAAFVHAAIGVPYGHLNYTNELTTAFGAASLWHEMTYEGVDAQKLFSDSYNYIYLEGSDNNANEMETFLTANHQLIEDWVAAGNALFLNAAPNEGDGMSFGFGGVQLVRGTYTSAHAVDATLPMFSGPQTPIATQFSGVYNLAAVICPTEMVMTPILASDNGTNLLVQATWGNGTVLFGGMNLTGFHQPLAEAYNFKINIHHYLKDLPIATVNSPLPIVLDKQNTYNLALTEIDLGSFDDCSLSNIAIDTSQFTCENVGLLDVVLTVTDVANNVSTCTTQVEIIDTAKTRLYENICRGDSFLFNGVHLTTEGIYLDTLLGINSCDSFIVLTLTELDTSQTQLMASICEGESYRFNGSDLMSGGIYRDTLQNENACDSFIVLTLTVTDTSQTDLTASICQGESYPFNGLDLITGGIYRDTLQNENACDSFILLNLTIENCTFDITCSEDTLLLLTGPIPEGGYWGEVAINSGMNLMPDSIVFQAGEEIILYPGFHAPAGSEFTAKIAPTTCEPPIDLLETAATARHDSKDLGFLLEDATNSTLKVSPNPFYERTIINFSINEGQTVHLSVYSAEGRLVQTLQNEYMPAGSHQATFNATFEQGRLYIIVLQTEQEVLTKKVVHTRFY